MYSLSVFLKVGQSLLLAWWPGLPQLEQCTRVLVTAGLSDMVFSAADASGFVVAISSLEAKFLASVASGWSIPRSVSGLDGKGPR